MPKDDKVKPKDDNIIEDARGEKVRIHPPTKRFPDGVKELVRDPMKSPLRRKFMARAEQHKQAKEKLRQVHLDRVEDKRQKMIRGGVPAEKRNV